MATITWTSFYPYVQPYLPGCPEIVMEAHLQETAAEFCADSEVWRYTLDTDYTSKNSSDYEIDVPKGSLLENLLYVKVNGIRVDQVSERHFRAPINADGTAVTGTPTCFSILDDASIRFYPTPDTKLSFNGLAVIKPKLSATGVEGFIFDAHSRAIASGTIAKLAEIPGKEWSSPELAMQHRVTYERKIATAKGRDTRRVNLQVSPIGFAD
jgi:hypothetical protein